MNREEFARLADQEEATLKRLAYVSRCNGLSEDTRGTYYHQEVQAIRIRASLYRKLAEETPDETMRRLLADRARA